MCLIINHFVMYYSNPQVNYMVTVFIRLVTAVVYTLHSLSCSKCFVCLCLFQYRHCFLVGWCTNKSYVIATSDLWLFIHASNLFPSTPHPHSPTLTMLTTIHLMYQYQCTITHVKIHKKQPAIYLSMHKNTCFGTYLNYVGTHMGTY